MIDILGKLVEDATGGKFTAQDMHKVRQLLPYQNMFYLNRLFNMAEGKTSDLFNLKHAQASACARLSESFERHRR